MEIGVINIGGNFNIFWRQFFNKVSVLFFLHLNIENDKRMNIFRFGPTFFSQIGQGMLAKTGNSIVGIAVFLSKLMKRSK